MCVVVQKQWQQRKYALGSSGPDSSYQNTKAFAYTCTNAKKKYGYMCDRREQDAAIPRKMIPDQRLAMLIILWILICVCLCAALTCEMQY